jgi:hypothetical protein
MLKLESVLLGEVEVDFETLKNFVSRSGKLGIRLNDKEPPSWFETSSLPNELVAKAIIADQASMSVKLSSPVAKAGESRCELSVSVSSPEIGFDSRGVGESIVLVNERNEPLVRVPFLLMKPRFEEMAVIDERLAFELVGLEAMHKELEVDLELFQDINAKLFEPIHGHQFERPADPEDPRVVILELRPLVPDSNSIKYPMLAIEIQNGDGKRKAKLVLNLFKNLLSKEQLDKGDETYKALAKPEKRIGKRVEFEDFRGREVIRSKQKQLKEFSAELVESAESVRTWFNDLILELGNREKAERERLNSQILEVGIRHEAVSELGAMSSTVFRDGLAEKLTSIVIPLEVREQDGWHLYLVKGSDWKSAEKKELSRLVENRLFLLLQQK